MLDASLLKQQARNYGMMIVQAYDNYVDALTRAMRSIGT